MPVISPSAFAPPVSAVLREKVRRLERAHSVQHAGKTAVPTGLPAIDALLPDGGLLTGALHEVEAGSAPSGRVAAHDGAALGFAAHLMGRFAARTPGTLLWCRRPSGVFDAPPYTPALAAWFDPARLLVVTARRDEDVFWAMEEGLRCPGIAAVLGETRATPDTALLPPSWLGAYIEPETGLSARIEHAAPGQILLRFGHSPERLDLLADGTAGNGRTKLRMASDGLRMDRPHENFSTCLQPAPGEAMADVGGRYRCAELDAELTVVESGGTLYGGFSGFLGQGRMELLNPIGTDLWALPCPRALDHTPPGDWTLAFRRNASGKAIRVEVGCWLARRLNYEKV